MTEFELWTFGTRNDRAAHLKTSWVRKYFLQNEQNSFGASDCRFQTLNVPLDDDVVVHQKAFTLIAFQTRFENNLS